MQEFCHRCGGELPAGSGESPFCPHCGTPQLFLAIENQSVETGGDPPPNADGTPSTGATPPPRPQLVEWKTAMGCAAAVAGVGALLNVAAMRVDILSPVGVMWILSASLITLVFYQKRRPTAKVDVAVGVRIGVVVGVFMALALGIGMASWGLVARYKLHTLGNFDMQMAQMQLQAVQKAVQQAAQQQPATPLPAWWMGFVTSQEMRAGMMLMTFAVVSAGLLVVCAVGGAFGGLLRTRRGPA